MPGLNRVELIGRLGRDPETRYTPTGRKVCQFSLAVDRRWRAASGESREATDWFNVEAWGRLGEICQEYLSKGRLVYLEGRLQTDRYEQGGETKYFTKETTDGGLTLVCLEQRSRLRQISLILIYNRQVARRLDFH